MKSVVTCVLLIVSIFLTSSVVFCADVDDVDGQSSTTIQSVRQARSFDGGFLTSGFVTAISSLGTIGVLGLILLGILLLPTLLSLLTSGVFLKRGFSGGYDVDKHAILERMSMLHDVWQKFDIKDAQCRKRLICEVHSIESDLGPSARRIIKFVDYVGHAGTLNLAPLFKNIVDEYVTAARLGKEVNDCSSFSSCPYSFAEQIKAQQSTSNKSSK